MKLSFLLRGDSHAPSNSNSLTVYEKRREGFLIGKAKGEEGKEETKTHQRNNSFTAHT